MTARAIQQLRKLAGLSAREWRDLIEAQLALIRAQRRVRRDPIGSLVARQPAPTTKPTGDLPRARAIALANMRAAEFGVFRPKCLVRVLALQEVLLAHGIRGGTVRVGVLRTQGTFMAHAWMTWRNEVLGDLPAHVARFTEVDDLRVMTGL